MYGYFHEDGLVLNVDLDYRCPLFTTGILAVLRMSIHAAGARSDILDL
jgi:hypothetical protein